MHCTAKQSFVYNFCSLKDTNEVKHTKYGISHRHMSWLKKIIHGRSVIPNCHHSQPSVLMLFTLLRTPSQESQLLLVNFAVCRLEVGLTASVGFGYHCTVGVVSCPCSANFEFPCEAVFCLLHKF